MPHYFGSNILNTGESCKELLKAVPSRSLSFLPESFLLFFFSQKSWQCSQSVHSKSAVDWIEAKLGKTLINTAWPLTSQTRAHQQDLETSPETTLTCQRFEHRKRNWEKTRINTGWSLNGQKCVYQRALGMASTIESEIGKNPWLTLNSPYYSNAYEYVKHTLQKTPERLRPLKVKLGKSL